MKAVFTRRDVNTVNKSIDNPYRQPRGRIVKSSSLSGTLRVIERKLSCLK